MKDLHYDFWKPETMYWNCLFYSTNSPETKNMKFTIRYYKEKQQIITFTGDIYDIQNQ